MKTFGYIVYAFVILILGYIFITVGNQAQRMEFYNTEGAKALENNNYNDYLDIFMQYNEYFEYLDKPVYHGQSTDNNFSFDFFILQSNLKAEDFDGTLNHFYFIDHLESYDHLFLDQESINLFYRNSKLAFYVIELYMEGESEPTLTPLEIHINENGESTYLDKVKANPLALTHNHLEDGNNYFRYITFETIEGKSEAVWNNAKRIERIDVHFADYTKTDGNNPEPIRTKLISITHDENNSLVDIDSFSKNEEGIYTSNSFNGHIDNYIDVGSFTNQEEVNLAFINNIRPYRSVRNSWILIYISIAALITYSAFFLNPTITYIKRKRFEKKYRDKQLRKKTVKDGQIFKDE